MIKLGEFIDSTFKDKTGHWDVIALPNLPLIIWAFATFLGMIFKHGIPHQVFSIIGLAAIVFWAVLEIFSGVNYFRRALGLVVLAVTIYSRF